jgi:hypothetical protein
MGYGIGDMVHSELQVQPLTLPQSVAMQAARLQQVRGTTAPPPPPPRGPGQACGCPAPAAPFPRPFFPPQGAGRGSSAGGSAPRARAGVASP